MLELDFAFFNFIDHDKQGLAYRKFFLDRLPPLFFSPRLEKIIELTAMRARGCLIKLPLGTGNWHNISQERQKILLEKSVNILKEHNINYLAVDRRCKRYLLPLAGSYALVFGDSFIKALAMVLIKEQILRRKISRLILIGEIDYYSEFIEEISKIGIPVSLQSVNPAAYEVAFYKLFYEHGCAVSNSYITPENWGKGDLVVFFDQPAARLALHLPEVISLHFDNQSCGITYELESDLERCGLTGRLCNLAPILETCLMAKAGFLTFNSEPEKADNSQYGKFFLKILEAGDNIGVWDLFLDKGI